MTRCLAIALLTAAVAAAQAPTKIDLLILGGDADAGGHKIENLDAPGSGLATTGQVAAVTAALAAATAPKTVAEIVIPMGAPWVDFEIKVSRTNFVDGVKDLWLSSLFDSFANWTSSEARSAKFQVRWIHAGYGPSNENRGQSFIWANDGDVSGHSPIVGAVEDLQQPFSYLTGASQSINYTPAEVIVEIYGMVGPDTTSTSLPDFNEANEHLFQFIYTRHTLSGTETNNFSGRRWHVAPVRWRKERTGLVE